MHLKKTNKPTAMRPWKPATIQLSALRINSARQRPIDDTKVDRIIREFDWRKVNVIKVCRFPNGLLAIADGQHTATAIAQRFGNILVDCEVCDVRDEHEFRLRVGDCNSRVSTKVTTADNFWIDTADKDETAELIHLAAKDNGYDIVRKPTNANQVNCVTAILRVYKKGGLDGVEATFAFAREVFCGHSLHDYIVEGIYLFLAHCGPDKAFNHRRVVDLLKRAPFPAIIRQTMTTAQQPGVTKARAFATALRDTYNDSNGKGSPDIKTDIP